ncbi:MAG: hypothetical protein ACO1TE_01460 [Prosthecobacter sp.]
MKYEHLAADDLNHTRTYLTLETGLCFFVPLGFSGFFRGKVDLRGHVKGDPGLPILNSPIKAVHVEVDDEDDALEDVLIELESGLCLYDRSMAPTGIPTGLFWLPRADVDWSSHRDYWEWHARHPEAMGSHGV